MRIHFMIRPDRFGIPVCLNVMVVFNVDGHIIYDNKQPNEKKQDFVRSDVRAQSSL